MLLPWESHGGIAVGKCEPVSSEILSYSHSKIPLECSGPGGLALAAFQVLPKLLCPCPSQLDRAEKMGWKALDWDKAHPTVAALSKTEPTWGTESNLVASKSERHHEK